MGMEAPPSWASCVATWTKARAQALWGRGRRSLWGRFLLKGDIAGGMISRVDVGAFPSSRWKGVTIILWASGGLALRAVLQMARKARHSLLSSSMDSASRC